jgi:hypothetical protein
MSVVFFDQDSTSHIASTQHKQTHICTHNTTQKKTQNNATQHKKPNEKHKHTFNLQDKKDEKAPLVLPTLPSVFSAKARSGCSMTFYPLRHGSTFKSRTLAYLGTVVQGCLCQDPVTSRVYWLPNFTADKRVVYWDSLDKFCSADLEASRAVEVETARHGTQHAVLNGFLYMCTSANTVAKVELATGKVVKSLTVPETSSAQYSWGGNTYCGFHLDRGNKLYLTYQHKSKGFTVSRVSPQSFELLTTWHVETKSKSTLGCAFIAGGAVYFNAVYTTNTVTSRYVLATEKTEQIRNSLGVDCSYISSISFNPATNRLFVVDNMRQHVLDDVVLYN